MEEGRTIRTCRLSRLVALVALLGAPAGAAQASLSGRPLLSTYAQARAAETLGAERHAVERYGVALAADPDNKVLAARALSQALSAGDFPLALRAARNLERVGSLAPDARFLLLVDAVRSRNWAEARKIADAVAADDVFSFMAPVFHAWIAQGSGKGDPLQALAKGTSDPLAIPFVSRHGPLLLMARGRDKDALDQLGKLTEADDSREWRIRLSAADRLARKRKTDQALALLSGEEAQFVAARRLVRAGKPLNSEIRTAPEGLAEFFLALSIDLREQGITSLALSFARLATFLSPDDAEARLITGELLAAAERESAVAVLRTVPREGPFGEIAIDSQIRILAQAGDHESALTQAEAATRASDSGAADWARLGDLYSHFERHSEAADAYGKALEAARSGRSRQPEWILWLLRGGALEQADRWTEAKAALEAAYALAPEQPLVLNYLGYAQIERRENIAAAEKLIRQASSLEPNSPQITDSLGWARYLLGDVDQAVELLERAVQGDPNDAAISEHLGDAYYSAGRHFEARYAWNAALVSAEGPDAERLRAKIDSGLKPELASP